MHTHSFVQDAEVTVHVRIIVFLPIKQGHSVANQSTHFPKG